MLFRDRAGVVIIQKQEVALIERIRHGMTYYVFPGGGIENGETPQQAARREAVEELGVDVRVGDLLSTITNGGKCEHYFKSKIISGKFGNGKGDEYIDGYRNRGTYRAVWIPLSNLHELTVYPLPLVPILKSY
ncbi:MAG: NUDIX domain-containing protein [Anaerobacillus sp.]